MLQQYKIILIPIIKFIQYFKLVIFECNFLMPVSLFTYTPHTFYVPFLSRCTNPIYSNSVSCLDTLPPLNQFFLLVNFPLVFIAAIYLSHRYRSSYLSQNLSTYFLLFQLTTTVSGDHVQNYTVFYVILFLHFLLILL